jgi:eukaryotic-like serine/threonine-protein kinase
MPLDARAAGPHQIGDYDILLKIADGGMGSVYKARHRITADIVAIKVLPPATAKNPTLLKRFEMEYRTAAVLDHPNIVRAIDFCGTGPNPFLVMEYVDGESLGQKVDREGPMPEDQAIRVIAQVCQGLHRAHKQKLIHRDVKPDNVLLTPDGVAKLTDLGLVKEVDNEMNLTKTGRGLGTPNFMAPEQFRNAKNADIRCDIYSLGATLYTMVTGEAPFGKVGPLDCWMRKIRNELIPPRELNPSVSERVDWAIRRAMSGDPDKRPGSCKEFVEDLMGASLRPPPGANEGQQSHDLWYLVYRDDEGEQHTVKGTTQSIRQALKDGLLGDASNVRAGRTKQGQFLGLTSHPEFRDLMIEPAPLPTQSPSPSGQMMRQTPPPPQSRTPVTPMPRRPDPEAVDYVYSPTTPPPGVSYYDPTQDYRPVSENSTRPLIPVGRSKRRADGEPQGIDWLLWGGVLVVALATSVAALFLLPRLKF